METKLIDDCFYLIFEYLDLPDLVNMAQVSAELYKIALYEFKQKYSHALLRVGILMNPPKSFIGSLLENIGLSQLTSEKTLQRSISNFTFDAVAQRMLINDYSLLINTIKYFGCLIHRVDMRKNVHDANAVKPIFEHLNKYSARSLIQLQVGHVKIEWLDELKGPFANLDEFTFNDSYEPSSEFRPKRLMIRKKFPNLRRLLYVDWIKGSDIVFPDEHFPKLEYVSIEWKLILSDYRMINKFLEQNSRISHLEVIGFPSDFIVKVHSLVPNLEKLTIDNTHRESSIIVREPVHFEHLKSFIVRSEVVPLESISFGNLQELRIVYNPDSVDKWNQFFRKNRNLTRLEIEQSHSSQIRWSNQFVNQLNGLPASVAEITLVSESYPVAIETIVGILGRRGHLIKLTYKAATSISKSELREKIGNNWNIKTPDNLDEGWSGVQFTRRN